MPQNDSWTKPCDQLDQLTGGNRRNFAQFVCIRDAVAFVHAIFAVPWDGSKPIRVIARL